ncbi:18839_t:CDS:2 [Gigaspora rosea]|nr:18839_t:CDS:2 [Gigaspora rosea]
MINSDTIRSTLPDPNLEQELYQKVCAYQIHTFQYLTTDPPNTRSKAVLPLYMINSFDEDPYWNDKIEKYFARLLDSIFDKITYKTYFETYDIKLSLLNTSNRTIYHDTLGNYVIKRKNHILTRMRIL